jgi:hypothetical protein
MNKPRIKRDAYRSINFNFQNSLSYSAGLWHSNTSKSQEKPMNPIVLDTIPFSLSAEELAPQLHIEPDSEDYELLGKLVVQACAIARPKAVFTASFITGRGDDYVELDNVRMLSRVMPVNLKDVHRAFPYVATCGEEAGEWSRGIKDPLFSWWADAIQIRLLRAASRYLHERLTDSLRLGRISSMNPGSLPDWPITEQTKLFSLFGDVRALIGVKLTDSMLMLPAKSVSGVYFEAERNFENCELCSRGNCPDRRKPFDEMKYQDMNL